jgi:hypothetical protein
MTKMEFFFKLLDRGESIIDKVDKATKRYPFKKYVKKVE